MNGDSCPFETGAGTTVTAPAPEAGGAEDVLSQYGVVIVLVILVAAVMILSRGAD